MIGILTYDVPHRKTYDVLCLLKMKLESKNGEEVAVFAEPLHYKKTFKPLIEHRPSVINEIYPEQICRNLGFKYYKGFDENILPQGSIILVCGAGIISDEIINKYRVINAHPGYIPNVRGLDALKWAIYDGQPIGVTTHQIGEHVDAGLIIDRKVVPLYSNDTFHAVAYRQYEMEVSMLVEAIDKIDSPAEYAEPLDFPQRKRMPHELEANIIDRFNFIIQKISID